MTIETIGSEMYELCKELFPICRSITGNGVRETLSILKRYLPELKIIEVSSGTKVFDWTIPPEWDIKDAYILDPDGNKIVDFRESNLHVLGYSIPVNKIVSLEELQKHLFSLPEQPDAIPYTTSYYNPNWGFCISEKQRQNLKEVNYTVFIDSELKENGSLTYGELIIPGKSNKEIFLSTYICHPSMANNELSGIAVTTFLAKWRQEIKNAKYTYRIIFIPETIGSITYLSKNYKEMKQYIIAGFNVSCVGDDRLYSYLPSRQGNSLSDTVAKHVLKHLCRRYVSYSFLDRGSDERQYCSPGIDLPVCSIMRSKYGCYPEYHTSLDNLNLISPEGLFGGYKVLKKAIECIDLNEIVKTTVLCEPQLGKRGLYPATSTKRGVSKQVNDMMNLLAYSDGILTTLEIADIIKVPLWELTDVITTLKNAGLLQNGCA